MWRLLQQAPVSADHPLYARWLTEAVTAEDLSHLPADDVDALGLFATRRSYPPSTVLFTRDGRPDAVHIIERGAVDLVHTDDRGEVVLQTVRRGVAVGDLPALLDLSHGYSAVTRTATSVLELRVETMRALLQLDPAICFRFLRLVSRRLVGLERRVLELGRRSAFERLVQALLRESEEQRSSIVHLTQADIAFELGLTRQTVSRTLGELERQGLVERRRGRIVIGDRDRLRQLADPHAHH